MEWNGIEAEKRNGREGKDKALPNKLLITSLCASNSLVVVVVA